MSDQIAVRSGAGLAGRTFGGLALRLGLSIGSRIRVGCLEVVLPDGRRRVFGDASSTRRAALTASGSRATSGATRTVSMPWRLP